MNGLILEIRGLSAIVLMPGGEMRRVLRRRGWRVGMIVDPDAVCGGGFARAGVALAMVLVLMLGLGAYRILAPRSDVPVAEQPSGRTPLSLTPVGATEATEALEPPDSAAATIAPIPTHTPRPAHHDEDDDDDDEDGYCSLCNEYGHDEDDHCDYCGMLGHDDDDCPYAPPGWDDDDD